MEFSKLNAALTDLVEKRNQLAAIDYSDPKYDDLEEVLHDLEDAFLDEFGDYLDGVLISVHDKNFPESDVLSPIAYLAKKYVAKNSGVSGRVEYDIPVKEGVWVESLEHPNKNVRLILMPNPPRLVLQFENGQQKEVWSIDKQAV